MKAPSVPNLRASLLQGSPISQDVSHLGRAGGSRACHMGCGLCLWIPAWLGWEGRGRGTLTGAPGGPSLRSYSPLDGTVNIESAPQNPAALPQLPDDPGQSFPSLPQWPPLDSELAGSHSCSIAPWVVRKEDNQPRERGAPWGHGRQPRAWRTEPGGLAQEGSREGPRLTQQRRSEQRAGSGGR